MAAILGRERVRYYYPLFHLLMIVEGALKQICFNAFLTKYKTNGDTKMYINKPRNFLVIGITGSNILLSIGGLPWN
jgi:uncharacterized membrane protein